MTRFESRPAAPGNGSTTSTSTCRAIPTQPQVGLALQELRAACAFFKVLGTYPIDSH